MNHHFKKHLIGMLIFFALASMVACRKNTTSVQQNEQTSTIPTISDADLRANFSRLVTMQITSIKLGGFIGRDLRINITVTLNNSLKTPLMIIGITHRFFINERPISDGEDKTASTIKAASTSGITVSALMKQSIIDEAIRMMAGQEPRFKLEGTLSIKQSDKGAPITVPFDLRGDRTVFGK